MANLKMPKKEGELKGMTIAGIKKAYLGIAEDYEKILENKTCYCPKCDKWLSSTNFYQNNKNADNLEHWGCKKDIVLGGCNYNKSTGELTDNKEKAIYMCRILDWVFIEKTYDDQVQAAIDGLNEKNRSTGWQQYIVMIQSLPQYRSLSFEQSEFLDADEAIGNNSNRKPRKEIIKLFGSGSYNNEEYLYLQDQYDDFKARTQVDSKSQETYVIQICCQLLDIRKARQQGKDTAKLTDGLSKLMGDANLQPKQNVDNAATDSLTFGQLIEKWENEKPIPEPSEEFKDVDGIGKYIRIWFKGHLARALGIDNGYSKEYDDFIAEYSVKKHEEEEYENSENIYNTIFGNNGD